MVFNKYKFTKRHIKSVFKFQDGLFLFRIDGNGKTEKTKDLDMAHDFNNGLPYIRPLTYVHPLEEEGIFVEFEVVSHFTEIIPTNKKYYEVIRDGIIVGVFEQNDGDYSVMFGLERDSIVDGYKEISMDAYELFKKEPWTGESESPDLLLGKDDQGNPILIPINELD